MTFDLLSCRPTLVESGSDAPQEPVDPLEDSGLDSKPILDSQPASRDDKVKFKGETGDESAMGHLSTASLLSFVLVARPYHCPLHPHAPGAVAVARHAHVGPWASSAFLV